MEINTLAPCRADQLGLSAVFLRALAQRVLQLGVEAAGLDAEAPTHGADRKGEAAAGSAPATRQGWQRG